MLPKQTEELWSFLKGQPGLDGFILVGGSALALRLEHRISEDLDFTWLGDSLPRERLNAVLKDAAKAEFLLAQNDNPAALDAFAIGGMDLRDYQQDYISDRGVKVSFFTATEGLEKVFGRESGPVRIASLDELFKSKCLVSARRSKTRDWFDLYTLLRNHGFTLSDYYDAFRDAGIAGQEEIGLNRLCSGTPDKSDEGYLHLLTNGPSLDEMKRFFTALRNHREIDLAAQAKRSTAKA